MFLFCPKCNAQHSTSGRCPRCSSRLLSPGEAADIIPSKTPALAPKTQIRSSFLRRLIVGILIALGFHLTLREWTLAVLGLLQLPTESESWDGINFSLRAISTLIGALIAGAGRKRCFSTGAMVGVASLVGYLLLDHLPHLQIEFWSIVKGTGFIFLGCFLSYVGGRIWPPPIELAKPDSPHNSSLLKLKPEHSGDQVEKIPTQWTQLTISITLVACSLMLGTLGGKTMLTLTPNPGEVLKDPLTLPRLQTQAAGLLILLAGLLAGSGTGAGLRHGLIAGLAGGLAVMGLTMANKPEPFRIGQYVSHLLRWEAGNPNELLVISGAAFVLVTIGAILGGSIFPRVIKQRRRRTDW